MINANTAREIADEITKPDDVMQIIHERIRAEAKLGKYGISLVYQFYSPTVRERLVKLGYTVRDTGLNWVISW